MISAALKFLDSEKRPAFRHEPFFGDAYVICEVISTIDDLVLGQYFSRERGLVPFGMVTIISVLSVESAGSPSWSAIIEQVINVSDGKLRFSWRRNSSRHT